jgi:hypothetical protein
VGGNVRTERHGERFAWAVWQQRIFESWVEIEFGQDGKPAIKDAMSMIIHPPDPHHGCMPHGQLLGLVVACMRG